MDIKLFNARLAELVKLFGAELATPVQVQFQQGSMLNLQFSVKYNPSFKEQS